MWTYLVTFCQFSVFDPYDNTIQEMFGFKMFKIALMHFFFLIMVRLT